MIEFQVARFPGCENEIDNKDKCAKDKMLEYVYKCIEYPNIFSGKRITGTVIVTFEVLDNGELSGLTISKGLNESIDMTVLSCFKKMENWIPSKDKNGNPFKTQFAIPISFPRES